MFGHKPHPARFSRYLTAGASTAAFLTLVGAFSLNAQAAQLAAAAADAEAQPASTPTSTPASPTASPVGKATPAVKAATPTKTTSKKTSTKKKSTSTSSTSTSSGGTSSGGSTSSGGTAPKPTASPTSNPTMSYTCKSPGGSTKPLKNGSCSYLAQYGYVKVAV